MVRPLLLVSLLSFAACGGADGDRRVYAGPVNGTDALVGVVIEGARALVYVCGGPTSLDQYNGWFEGEIVDGALSASGAGGALTLETVGDEVVRGAITPSLGRPATWAASDSVANAEVFRGPAPAAPCDTGGIIVGEHDGEPIFVGTFCDGPPNLVGQVSPVRPFDLTAAGISVSVPRASGAETLRLAPAAP